MARPSVSYSQFDFRQLPTPDPTGPQLATSPLNLIKLLKLFAIPQTPENSFPSHLGGRQRSSTSGVRTILCRQQRISRKEVSSPLYPLLSWGDRCLWDPSTQSRPPTLLSPRYTTSWVQSHCQAQPKVLSSWASAAVAAGVYQPWVWLENPGTVGIRPWEFSHQAAGYLGILSGCVRSRKALNSLCHGAPRPAQPQPQVPPLVPP